MTVERGLDELARGRRTAHRCHAEERRHEDVRDELDLARHDADVERARDLDRQRGAPADEDREHHRDRGERNEIHGDGVTWDERATRGGDHDERQADDHQLAIVGPRLGRVALDEQPDDAGDDERPAKEPDRALPVDARVHQAERAELLEILFGDDLAFTDHDLVRRDLHLHG